MPLDLAFPGGDLRERGDATRDQVTDPPSRFRNCGEQSLLRFRRHGWARGWGTDDAFDSRESRRCPGQSDYDRRGSRAVGIILVCRSTFVFCFAPYLKDTELDGFPPDRDALDIGFDDVPIA